jgi:LysM repeat protein
MALAAAALIVPAAACAAVTHTVRRGETLTSIAASDGLSVAGLAAANGLSSQAQLVTGTPLVIPAQGGPLPSSSGATSEAAPAPVSSESASPSGGYVVRAGDTLSGIAARAGTTAAALAAANGMSVNDVLLAGRTLTVPGGSAQSSAPAPAPGASGSGAQPVNQYVSPGDIGSIAAADGVPPALAEAIADQESGFNDGLVSSSGAVGVMQLEPTTWNDLSRIDGMDLSPTAPLDNVRGGVAVLRSLLLATGDNQNETIAAYYQGLDSVRTQGVLPSTRRYVTDVLALEGRF